MNVKRLLVLLLSCLVLAGCAPGQTSSPAGQSGPGSAGDGPGSSSASPEGDGQSPAEERIPFQEGQLYAVAYLGYLEMEDLEAYAQTYLDGGQTPVHYFSPGDFYLIIPRYPDMALSLYRNDITTSDSALVYEEPNCRPFVIQCNVSDIFPDATIQLDREGESVQFSPFISLKDGSLDVGARGLDLTGSVPPS